MAVDGHLNFDTKINTKGFDRGLADITKTLQSLKGAFLKLGGIIGAAFSVSAIKSFAEEAKELWNVQLEAETKLETILGRNLGATREQIQAVKDYASALQEVGVIGDEVQLSGLQELSTYIENASSLKTMNEVLNDMLAQQYGLNATAESAVTIATMLGKVLEGQTSALSRYGYSFDAAQEQLLKFGTEEQRVATLAEVVQASVGGINEALANTDAGRLKQLDNTLGDIKEQFGAAITQIEVLFLPALKRLAQMLAEVATFARELAQSLSEVFGTSNKQAAAAAQIAQSYEDMAEAAEAAQEANEGSLMSFDKINKISGEDSSSEESGGSVGSTFGADIEATEGRFTAFINSLKSQFSELFKPIKNSWTKYGQGTIDSAENAFESLRSLAGTVANSAEEVWQNGTGESILSAQLGILSNMLDTVTNLTDKFKEAWETDGLGTDILQNAADIYATILNHIENITEKTSQWAGGLDFTPALTALNGLEEALQPLEDTAWSGVEWLFDNVFLPISEWTLEEALPATLDLISAALEALNAAAKALKPYGKWLWDKFLKPMKDFAGDVVIGFLEELTDLLEDLTDLLNGDTSLSEFTGQLNTMQKAILTLSGLLAGGKIIGGIKGLTAAFSAAKAPAWISGIATFFTTTLPQTVMPAVSGFFSNTLLPAISGFFTQTLPAFFSTALGGVVAALGAFFAGWGIGTLLKKYLLDPVFDFQDAFNVGMDTIMGWFKERIDDFLVGGEMIGKFIAQDLPEFFAGVPGRIEGFFIGIGKWFTDRFREARDGVVSAFSDIGMWFSQRYADVRNVFRQIGKWFGERFDAAYSAVTTAFSGIGAFFSGLWEDITGGLRGMVNAVIDALNGMISGINSISFTMPDWDWMPDNMRGATLGFDIPQIPRLATGTVVPANYGEFLAVLGDNKRETEVVSPMSTIEQAVMSAMLKLGLTGQNGQKQPLIVNVMITNKRALGQAVIDDINDQTRLNGYSPLKT